MTLIGVGDIELDYERSGSGTPLLLIMGMSGTALHWGEPFLERLRSEFGIYGVDSGRICVAALNAKNLDAVVVAIVKVSS